MLNLRKLEFVAGFKFQFIPASKTAHSLTTIGMVHLRFWLKNCMWWELNVGMHRLINQILGIAYLLHKHNINWCNLCMLHPWSCHTFPFFCRASSIVKVGSGQIFWIFLQIYSIPNIVGESNMAHIEGFQICTCMHLSTGFCFVFCHSWYKIDNFVRKWFHRACKYNVIPVCTQIK